MASFQWIPDIPAGVLRNNSLSKALRRQAIAESLFQAHVKPEPGYGKKKGDTHTITTFMAIAERTNFRLSETQKIPISSAAVATRSIVVTEWGDGVEYTNLSEELTWFNLDSEIQKALKDQMKLGLDTGAAAAFKACFIKYIPTSLAGGVFDTDGTPSTQATENGTLAHVAEIRDYLKSTLFAPTVDSGGNYMCLASTKFLRGLKNDPDWEEWTKYTNPEKKYNSEVGRIEQCRFAEVNHANALSPNKGAGNILGEAVFFGADAVASVWAHDPELLIAIPGDFGRQKACAWYGIGEFGEVHNVNTPGRARIVHVTSS